LLIVVGKYTYKGYEAIKATEEVASLTVRTEEAVIKKTAAKGTGKISTPYGDAVQSISKEAKEVKQYTEQGGTLYRAGQFGRSNTSDAQFWAPESPFTPGYPEKYGVDFQNVDYVIGGKLKNGEPFITRPAPGLGNNQGGAIETVTNPNAIKLDFFHMP
jgi:filamentous hemagglutinin